MAKWGEGDPRWVVEHRPEDGRNPGGWHWEEKNCLEFSRKRIPLLLEGLDVELPPPLLGRAALKTVKTIEGEANITRRKANKKASLFDLTISCTWEATVLGDTDTTITGEIKISEYASHNDEDEYVFAVSTDSKSAEATRAKDAVAGMRAAVFQALAQYAAELAETPF